jgi:hypothetical protein
MFSLSNLSRIPVVCAIIVFFYLHRRHVKKLRREDAQDKYKSLDFGMDGSDLPTTGKKGKKGKKDKNAPEMMGTDLESEKAFRKDRGMSMDMGSPYLLPPDMQGSRESLHSLSRTIHGGDDRYRPAASFVGNDGASIHSFPSRLGDDSPYSPSNPPKRNISLANKEHDFAFGVDSPPLPEVPEVAHARGNPAPDAATAGLLPPSLDPDTRDSYIVKDGGDLRRSNNYLGAFINDRASSMDPDKQIPKSSDGFPDAPLPTLQQNDERKSPPTAMTARPEVALAHQQSYEAPIIEISEDKEVLDNEFGDGFKVTPPSVHRTSDPNENPFESNHHELDSSEIHAPEALHAGLDAPELGYDLRRLSMGFVPLPPEDPSDDAEQRANRIRSFYKEYFDDSKPGPVGDEYYEDYGESYLGDVAVFDPESGQFIMGGNAPFAQPVTRRAMTPPPRAPPRFQGPPRHGPSMSNGPFMGQVPRAFSSQSGRMGPGPPGARRPGPPRKALPPPSPLRVLPTPHMLKDDSFLPMDFAPPSTAKDRAAGRPSTPTGGLKPYSPMLPAHQPLVSAFDDLAVMPSPSVYSLYSVTSANLSQTCSSKIRDIYCSGLCTTTEIPQR